MALVGGCFGGFCFGRMSRPQLESGQQYKVQADVGCWVLDPTRHICKSDD